MNHSPLPWGIKMFSYGHHNFDICLTDKDGKYVSARGAIWDSKDVDYILFACNNWERLLKAAKRFLAAHTIEENVSSGDAHAVMVAIEEECAAAADLADILKETGGEKQAH